MGAVQPRPLPWTLVMAWADRHGYGPDRAEFLDACLAALDREYLAWWERQQPKAKPR